MWGRRVGQPPPCEACQLQHGMPRSTICHLTESASCHLAASPLGPSCLSLPLLPVWMNVSTLSPWLLDFRAVQFSVSSGCFLFLNCCCPSCGCARRCSVSTYISIFAGSSTYMVLKYHDMIQPCPPCVAFESHSAWKLGTASNTILMKSGLNIY